MFLLKQHLLSVQVLGREFAAGVDFERRGSSTRPAGGKHAGVNQEHFPAEAASNMPHLLDGVGDDNVGRIVCGQ